MSEKKNMSRTGIQPGTFKRLMAYLFSHYRVQLITVILCIIITAVASVGQTVYIQILMSCMKMKMKREKRKKRKCSEEGEKDVGRKR